MKIIIKQPVTKSVLSGACLSFIEGLKYASLVTQ